MKKSILVVLLSAVAGGLASFGVVKSMSSAEPVEANVAEAAHFRTVNLSHDNWPDFTYAAESAVDAVVYVKTTVTHSQP